MATEVLVPAAAPALPRQTQAGSPALFNPALDLLALGGLSIFAYLALFSLDYLSRTVSVAALVLIGNYLVNFPHYSATYFRAYRGVGEVKRYFGVCVIAPLILAGCAALAFASPELWAVWFCKAYLLSTGWHYSGQTYGIALIFAGKAKMTFTRGQKWLLMGPIYLSFAFLLGHKEAAGAPADDLLGVTMRPLGLPDWVVPLSTVLFGVGLGLYGVLNLYWYVRHGRLLPVICHVVVGSQALWFVWGAGNPAYSSLVPFFHCLQYLVITSYFYFRSVLGRNPAESPARSLFGSGPFLIYYAGLVALGVLLFVLIPYGLSLASVAQFNLAAAVCVAFINLHHFLLDGRIWRLRKPDVGKVLIQPGAAA